MHVGCNVASLASSVDPERGFLRRSCSGRAVSHRCGAQIAGWNAREKAPHAEEKTSWKTQIEESGKVRVGEGLEQVEGVKWNVWRNFLIAAASSQQAEK